MSADLIDFASKRATQSEAREHDVAEHIEAAFPDLSPQACRTLAKVTLHRSKASPPLIEPDHPIFGLFDTYKTAERTYLDAMRSLARRHGRRMSSMAGILRSVRWRAKNPRRFLTPAELKAKYEAMSPEEKASLSRELLRVAGETPPGTGAPDRGA